MEFILIAGNVARVPGVSMPSTVVPADLAVRLAGERVVVEPLGPEHADGLIAAATDPAMFRWMPVDMASSSDALREWLATTLANARAGTEVPLAILDAGSGEVLGSTRFLSLALEHLRAEIGWTWLTPSRWGSGVNIETKLLLLDHAFETAGLRRVEFKTDARNERSRGALTALGTRFEGIFRKHMVRPDGGARDSACYAIVDDDWPTVRQHLRARLETKR
jgi:RimJ/RimL family protein N-acetyltransferase